MLPLESSYASVIGAPAAVSSRLRFVFAQCKLEIPLLKPPTADEKAWMASHYCPCNQSATVWAALSTQTDTSAMFLFAVTLEDRAKPSAELVRHVQFYAVGIQPICARSGWNTRICWWIATRSKR